MALIAKSVDGLDIAYEVAGQGRPLVLIHGFASDRAQNWKAPLWFDALTTAGFRVIALDCRGHGESGKPHEPARYTNDLMADDVLSVMDREKIPLADVMGYSMGGMLGVHFLLRHPARIRKLVIGGVGEYYLHDRSADPRIAETAAALEVEDKCTIVNPMAKAFRDFADQAGKDRLALAACMRGNRPNRTAVELARAEQPVLVVCGENDNLSGPPGPLAASFANGRAFIVPRRDHMTCVGDRLYKQAVLEFLSP